MQYAGNPENACREVRTYCYVNYNEQDSGSPHSTFSDTKVMAISQSFLILSRIKVPAALLAIMKDKEIASRQYNCLSVSASLNR